MKIMIVRHCITGGKSDIVREEINLDGLLAVEFETAAGIVAVRFGRDRGGIEVQSPSGRIGLHPIVSNCVRINVEE